MRCASTRSNSKIWLVTTPSRQISANQSPDRVRVLTDRPHCASMGAGSLSGGRNSLGDFNRVRLSPDRLPGAEVEAVHGGLQVVSIHVHKQVVVVDLLALERVAGSAFNGIGVSSRST